MVYYSIPEPNPYADTPLMRMQNPDPNLHFRTRDHPEAHGKKPRQGDREWILHWILDDGRILYLSMGKEAHDAFRGFLLHEELDDCADEAAGNL